jgi:7,8-dihydro-6-hydroxymethylpterin dimethyltransferase
MGRHTHARDYTFLGTTQSLCPQCLGLVNTKIIARRGRVYFRKHCPTHGWREDFICSDVEMYDRTDYSLPARLPANTFTKMEKGCPFDCGLCEEHEQHTCVGLVEITSSCNLKCPMCFAASGPGGKHLSMDEAKRAIDRLVQSEGRPEVLQLSGGEPTIHPEFIDILEYALAQPIDYIMINTNGLRFAKDDGLVATIAQHKQRMEIYFQLDGLNEETSIALRGESLVPQKLRALEKLGEAGVHVTLVATLQGGVNLDQIGPLVRYATERDWVTGLSLQPATYSGRHYLPEDLENRVTFPDVIKAMEEQTEGMFQTKDFFPLPCAHPNCHQLCLAYRHADGLTPLTRFVNAKENLDLLANGISFTREEGVRLIQQYLARQACCGPSGCGDNTGCSTNLSQVDTPKSLPILSLKNDTDTTAEDFFAQALLKQLGARNLFRITINNFLDMYNFDVRRVMKCCTHHVLPSGHVIPFCAYNVLYREGHVPLPELIR